MSNGTVPNGTVKYKRKSTSGAAKVQDKKVGFAEGWNRTSDTSIFSAVLYRLSYLGTAIRREAEP